MALSLYKALKMSGIEVNNHESDLYVAVSTEVNTILEQFPQHMKTATLFRDNVSGKISYDIPFAYDPFWEKKA